DECVWVNGAYAPPIVGWQNYVADYQKSMAQFQGMQLIRRNTYVFVHQDIAWATYQWEFLSNYQGKPYSAHGQTTLVLQKIGDNWVKVLTHTTKIGDRVKEQHQKQARPGRQRAQAPPQNPSNAAPPKP